ncbi:hypothetical protein BGZ60DRAFT_431920 [Tricladium varicosporioides]|nr:hypothetical protein BGZ60DRAFT_431920 [Hymenoscyphus varicosporioides]
MPSPDIIGGLLCLSWPAPRTCLRGRKGVASPFSITTYTTPSGIIRPLFHGHFGDSFRAIGSRCEERHRPRQKSLALLAGDLGGLKSFDEYATGIEMAQTTCPLPINQRGRVVHCSREVDESDD